MTKVEDPIPSRETRRRKEAKEDNKRLEVVQVAVGDKEHRDESTRATAYRSREQKENDRTTTLP